MPKEEMAMLTKMDLVKIIKECRLMGACGLGNGVKATINTLQLDFLSPPNNFLGTADNPAIFVNEHTYRLLGKFHKSWKLNQTIAVQDELLDQPTMHVIGVLVHEAGHAFNVAASIANTEANAYVFEIEVLSRWFRAHNPMLFNCTKSDVMGYLKSRLSNYHHAKGKDDYLDRLICLIEIDHLFEKPGSMAVGPFIRTPRYQMLMPRYATLQGVLRRKVRNFPACPYNPLPVWIVASKLIFIRLYKF